MIKYKHLGGKLCIVQIVCVIETTPLVPRECYKENLGSCSKILSTKNFYNSSSCLVYFYRMWDKIAMANQKTNLCKWGKVKIFGNYTNRSQSHARRSQEQIESGNPSYPSVQNLLSSSLLSKNITIEICRIITTPGALSGCETLSYEHRPRVLQTTLYIIILWRCACCVQLQLISHG